MLEERFRCQLKLRHRIHHDTRLQGNHPCNLLLSTSTHNSPLSPTAPVNAPTTQSCPCPRISASQSTTTAIATTKIARRTLSMTTMAMATSYFAGSTTHCTTSSRRWATMTLQTILVTVLTSSGSTHRSTAASPTCTARIALVLMTRGGIGNVSILFGIETQNIKALGIFIRMRISVLGFVVIVCRLMLNFRACLL